MTGAGVRTALAGILAMVAATAAVADEPGPLRITIGVPGDQAGISIGAPAEPTHLTIGVGPGSGRVTISRASDALGALVHTPRVTIRTRGMPQSAPLQGGFALTSSFGASRLSAFGGRRSHLGVDLAAPTGTPIVATLDGTVSAAEWRGGYGLYIAVEHGGGMQTRYGHLSRLNVRPGQRIHKGDVIGYVGSTGRSTGPHLHYEVRENGQALNPLRQ